MSFPIGYPSPCRAAVSCYAIPHFKHVDKDVIEAHAEAFRKVAENADQLLNRSRASA